MSFPAARSWATRLSRMTIVATFSLVLIGCGATSAPGSSTGGQASLVPSVAASASAAAASPTVSVRPSASAGPCLPAPIMAAIKEVARANFKPATPLSEVADALEALDFGGDRAAEIRDELVTQLRDPAPTKTRQLLVHVANVFLSRGHVTEC